MDPRLASVQTSRTTLRILSKTPVDLVQEQSIRMIPRLHRAVTLAVLELEDLKRLQTMELPFRSPVADNLPVERSYLTLVPAPISGHV
jgi:hypothetical protein